MAQPTREYKSGGLDDYHITTIEQLDELPYSVAWGQRIALTYVVARHWAAVDALEE